MTYGPDRIRDRVPAGVMYYLLPQETQVITVRYHPAVLVGPVLAVLAACAAGSTITVFTRIGGTTLIAIWAVAAIACALLAIKVWAWFNDYFVLTRQRAIFIPAFIKYRMVSIPARDIGDVNFRRTLPGRLLGYGLLTLESVRKGHALRVIKYIPYPEHLYLEVCGMLFGEEP